MTKLVAILLVTSVCLTARADDDPIVALVRRWADAQNRGDFTAYSALYAPGFHGVRRSGDRRVELDRAGWLKDRARMFRKPMQVTIDTPTVHGDVVEFLQTFQSGRYADQGRKRLTLETHGTATLIAGEELLESRPLAGQSAIAIPTLAKSAFKGFSDGDPVPQFGCFARSAAQNVVACVLGEIATDTGYADLVFASLGDDPPPSVHLFGDRDYEGRVPARLEPAVRRRAAEALRGYASIVPTATLEGSTQRDKIRVTKKKRSAGGDNAPARYDVKLEHLEGSRWITLDEKADAAISEYRVDVCELAGAMVIEREAETREEGSHGWTADAWLCRETCEQIFESD